MARHLTGDLLSSWEANYKKGLLTFFLLLILHEQEGYAFEMAPKVAEYSQGTLTADENSIYRALNRFEGLGIVRSTRRQSDLGPPRRYYQLTETGADLLRAFVARDLLIFQREPLSGRIQAVLDGAPPRKETG
jgi:DNA-binding PadR family transcriptional regulator